MTPEQFTYWLQGFAELNGEVPPNLSQWQMIKDHLALQFKKVTPPMKETKAPPTGQDKPPMKISDYVSPVVSPYPPFDRVTC